MGAGTNFPPGLKNRIGSAGMTMEGRLYERSTAKSFIVLYSAILRNCFLFSSIMPYENAHL